MKKSRFIHQPASTGASRREVREIRSSLRRRTNRYGYEDDCLDLAKSIPVSPEACIYKFLNQAGHWRDDLRQPACPQIQSRLQRRSRPGRSAARAAAAHVQSDCGIQPPPFSRTGSSEIAASAATGAGRHACLRGTYPEAAQDIFGGPSGGDFERKTPLDETTMAIYLVMRYQIRCCCSTASRLPHRPGAGQLSSLVLRSLSP